MKGLCVAILAMVVGFPGVDGGPPVLPGLQPAGPVATAIIAQPGGSSGKKGKAQPRKKKGAKGALSAKDSASLRRRVREALAAGDLPRASRLLRRASGVKKRSERQAWLLLEAELAHAKREYASAALAAMRLVILHPRSDRVGAALYWVGRSYEGLERPRKAAELYEEVLARKRLKSSIRKAAKARLAALSKSAS